MNEINNAQYIAKISSELDDINVAEARIRYYLKMLEKKNHE